MSLRKLNRFAFSNFKTAKAFYFENVSCASPEILVTLTTYERVNTRLYIVYFGLIVLIPNEVILYQFNSN